MSELSPVSRSNLRQGALYMLVGLLWGMVIPASPFPRLALGAHIQLTVHGVMFLVAGLVILHLPFAKGKGEWVVGRSENAPTRSKSSWGIRGGTVARSHRYGHPSDRRYRLDYLLGSHCGWAVP